MRFQDAFTACQVYQVKLSGFGWLKVLPNLYIHLENGVRPARLRVQLGLSHIPRNVSLLKEPLNLLVAADLVFREPINMRALGNALTNFQVFLSGIDQVINAFVVNLPLLAYQMNLPPDRRL